MPDHRAERCYLRECDLISALAARYRVPAIYPFAFYANAGGLVSYAYDAAEQFRQGAGYVDRLLKAAKPADLPVQHPSKFEPSHQPQYG
jgi:putative ABC transport system substrate-binding protein